VTVSTEPLLEACRTVGDQSGIAIVEPDRSLPPNLKTALRLVAKSSQMRVRKVLLEEGWFPVEAGPMVATMKEDGRPVALAQARSGGYLLIDHGRGERHPLDEAHAALLSPEAYVFYKAWPAVPLTGRHVLAMGLRGTRGDILRIVAFGIASALLALITPIATAQLFNEIIPTAARERLLVLVGALLLGAVAGTAFGIAQAVALVRLQTRFNESLGAALWDRILRLPVPFFRLYSIGDLANRTLSIDAIRQILAEAGFSVVLSAVFSLSSLVLLFVYDPSLALIAVSLLAVSSGVTLVLTIKEVRRQRELLELRGELSGMVVQQVVGVSKLRVTAAERRAFAQWSALFARQQTTTFEASKLSNLQTVFNAGWIPFTTLVIFWWLSRRSLDSIDPGTFLAFLAAFGQILVANRAITAALGGMLQTVPLYERAKPIFEAVPEVFQNAQDPGALGGGVEVSHVDFRYSADGPLVLHDVSIRVEPGQFVAMVGPSGAGKSSLIRLLLGFECAEAGSVLFDGKDLATLDVELVRRQIGVVLQTAQLMPGSIFTNIVGETELTRDDAWLAASQAGLDGDLRNMPMGMDTLITEASGTLSGGQKQRLLIARALAMRPRFLLFDEATSALDNITQKTVTESLERLAVTRIVIAHRLSTIAGADKIIVMESGRVTETGTYDELMANKGPFSELAARQIV
jgi:NHLM bacteriocin system ABC transporter ATP-binding protein